MKLSSLLFAAVGFFAIFGIYMTLGPKDPIDDRFFTGLMWVSLMSLMGGVLFQVLSQKKERREMLRRFKESNWTTREDEHSGVRR